MKLEERNGLRVLTCDFGYLLHDTINDYYANKIYLGKNASLNNFKEVKDENINEKIVGKINELQENTENLNNINDEQDSIIIDSVIQIAIMQLTM